MGIFEYVMVLASIIIGLGITHLLQGVAALIQHPTRKPIYWVHLVWVAYMFVIAVFWWWWEFRFQAIHAWTFQLYLFVLGYAFVIYLLCAVLFPGDLAEYDGFKQFFYARRAWFFGLQAFYLAIDLVDSWAKGAAHFASLGTEYVVTTVLQIAFCIVGGVVRNERFHAVFAVVMLGYQISWALRYFDTLN